jgi:hypothetical protein
MEKYFKIFKIITVYISMLDKYLWHCVQLEEIIQSACVLVISIVLLYHNRQAIVFIQRGNKPLFYRIDKHYCILYVRYILSGLKLGFLNIYCNYINVILIILICWFTKL